MITVRTSQRFNSDFDKIRLTTLLVRCRPFVVAVRSYRVHYGEVFIAFKRGIPKRIFLRATAVKERRLWYDGVDQGSPTPDLLFLGSRP